MFRDESTPFGRKLIRRGGWRRRRAHRGGEFDIGQMESNRQHCRKGLWRNRHRSMQQWTSFIVRGILNRGPRNRPTTWHHRWLNGCVHAMGWPLMKDWRGMVWKLCQVQFNRSSRIRSWIIIYDWWRIRVQSLLEAIYLILYFFEFSLNIDEISKCEIRE